MSTSTTKPVLAVAKPLRALSSESLAMGLVFALTLTVVQRALGGVRGLMFCRMMSDQELGQWSMLQSVLLALAPLAVLGLPGCFGKFVEHYHREGQLRPFLRRISVLCALATLVVAASIVLFPRFFGDQILGDASQVVLMYYMAATLVCLSVLNFLTTLVESMRQIRVVSIMRFVSGVGFTFLGIGLLYWLPNGSQSVAIAFLLSCVLGILPAIWYLKRWQIETHSESVTHLPNFEMWARLAPYAFWWWLSNMIHNLFEFADRYMLIHWTREGHEVAQAVVGQYHSGRVIPLLMVGVAAMLSGLLLPYVAKSWADGNIAKARAQLNWTIKFSAIGMMAANVLLLLAGPFVFNVLLDGKYNGGLAVFPITMLYCTWFSMATLSQDFLWVSEKGKLAVGALGTGLLTNIVLNALLIPHYGLWGAVIGTTIGTVATLLLLFVANARHACPPDIGCWAAVLLPLILLLPSTFAVIAFAAFVALVICTNVVFDREEKSQIVDFAKGIGHKFS